jgi:GNAT superfamily N-acetyltransferase
MLTLPGVAFEVCYTIRNISSAPRPADAPGLARLIEEFNAGHIPISIAPEQAAARLAAAAGIETTFVAESDGQLAGFACLRLVPYMSGDEPYAELTDLFVTAPFRRRGAARALIERVERMARQPGAHEMIIMTGFDNDRAQSLYRAMGYDDHALALKRTLGE